MLLHSRTGYLTLLGLLAGPTFVAASCDNDLNIGQDGGNGGATAGANGDVKGGANTMGGSTAAGGFDSGKGGALADGKGGASSGNVLECKNAACAGPAPKSATYLCADGSIAGPICASEANGPCEWMVRSCPVEVLEFKCDDGSKISQTLVCNQKKECPDGSDEKGCSTPDPNTFVCVDGSKPEKVVLCNLIKECPDGSDEINCSTQEPGVFKCNDGAVLPIQLLCNEKKECPDGSDEINCSPQDPNIFVCADGSKIASLLVCNQRKDCLDGSDEIKCPPYDPEIYFCNDHSKVSIKVVCDDTKDCPDGSDEVNCAGDNEPNFVCADASKTLIPQSQVCDGDKQCPDGSDEVNCPPPSDKCESGYALGWRYDPVKNCIHDSEVIGCAELIHPDESLPDDWPSNHCARRKLDGVVFLVGEPQRITTWAECTPEQIDASSTATLCSEK